MNIKKLVNLFYEWGMLRRIKHEGWRVAGVNSPECVASHSLRAAQIAFFLAKMEKHQNPHKICTMLVFHDIGECRIGDIHKIANRYVKADEEKAVQDQLNPLNKDGEEILKLWQKNEYRKTKAGQIARDADLLEQAITAREYIENGHKQAIDWINNIQKHLSTPSAKKLLPEIKKTSPHNWWQGLKKIK